MTSGAIGRRMLREALVWDNHVCAPLRPDDHSFLSELARFKAVGVDVVSLNVGFDIHDIEHHVRMLASLRDWVTARADHYRLVLTVDDILDARRTGRLGVCFDIEGMNAVRGQPSLVRLFYELGVRWMLVAYNEANSAGGGCQAPDAGLTDFGRAVIDEMVSAGMVPCCSHTGYFTASQVISHSRGPVIFSHSNARAIHDHPRNIPDDLIRECADKGGVVGVNGLGLFLGGGGAVPEFVRHIEHLIKVGGEDHVSLALDYTLDQAEVLENLRKLEKVFPASFGYGAGMTMLAPEDMIAIVELLIERSHPYSRIEKILGGNLLRVAQECWK